MGFLKSFFSFLPGAQSIIETFKPNTENQTVRTHESDLQDMSQDSSVINQFATEFHARQKRTWWDSLVDGLNRLPRPLLTFSVLGFFILAPLDPDKFAKISAAYALVPNGYWALLSVIVGFYFGGRMQLKSQEMVMHEKTIQASKELVRNRREFRELPDPEESQQEVQFQSAIAQGAKPPRNQIVREWLDNRTK